MSDNPASKDVYRARAAALCIVDGRNMREEESQILVTLEHTVATLLLAFYPDPRKAAAMLNEGLIPGIEARLSKYAAAKAKIDADIAISPIPEPETPIDLPETPKIFFTAQDPNCAVRTAEQKGWQLSSGIVSSWRWTTPEGATAIYIASPEAIRELPPGSHVEIGIFPAGIPAGILEAIASLKPKTA